MIPSWYVFLAPTGSCHLGFHLPEEPGGRIFSLREVCGVLQGFLRKLAALAWCFDGQFVVIRGDMRGGHGQFAVTI